MILSILAAAALVVPVEIVKEAFGDGALTLIECGTGEVFRSDEKRCEGKMAPCSTFKIWNTAIGLETGEIAGADELFWKWDGEKRFLDAWNKDQTLRSAFAVSCVPAYQDVARRIGKERMAEWLAKIGYGDEDISAGIDVFWLNPEGKKPLLISADEQAALVCRLAEGKVPFSGKTLAVLKDVMLAKKTDKGTMYGKTGSGVGKDGDFGWWVGYAESGGKTYGFAGWVKGKGVLGKDVRAKVEAILGEMGLL